MATTPATTPAIHLSPITAKSRRLTLQGPIYQRTATGEVVPYVAPAPGAQLTSATGGSPVGTDRRHDDDMARSNDYWPQLLVPARSPVM